MDWQSLLNSSAALLIGAFLLDLAVGDPRWLPHPVVLMGKVISHGERWLRSGNARRDFLAGMTLSLFLVTLSVAVALGLVVLFKLLPLWFSFSATAALASTTLATRGLLDAVKLIEAPLRAGNLVAAREKLSHIVGRETSNLNQDKVLRASLETLSESACDGIVAPLFYLFLGGVPLAMAYKAVSTLDSMIGYRTERYFYFGKVAARLDDAMNFIPARLTALFIVLATLAARLNPARALRIAWRDHANHLSPNAGYPEAALAGAFGIRLGGPSIYFGQEICKPYMGDDLQPVRIEMLKEGRALCLVTAILSLATFALLSTARG
ncbi:MAG TPA: adenosylcobinamide-phosphate synthase CbiB [Candidatus Binatia bacterium]|jgi:adenosylcobinamide-phosphate synthase|nr:adenosylcobinamide-phosphate synthase CbiB [Candidatus Binatia bacterium]